MRRDSDLRSHPFYAQGKAVDFMQGSLRHFRIAKAISSRILYGNLGMEKRHLRWIPQALDANQKAERIVFSQELLTVRKRSPPTGFQNIRTGDEPCFFFSYPRNSIWVHSRDAVPERVQSTN
jgi:hypothetical protein